MGATGQNRAPGASPYGRRALGLGRRLGGEPGRYRDGSGTINEGGPGRYRDGFRVGERWALSVVAGAMGCVSAQISSLGTMSGTISNTICRQPYQGLGTIGTMIFLNFKREKDR